jgi:hypothetical protein
VEDSFVQPLRSVQAVQAVNFRIVRSATLFAVAFGSQEALRFIGAQLYGDIQPHSAFGKGHRLKRYSAKHAAHRRNY